MTAADTTVRVEETTVSPSRWNPASLAVLATLVGLSIWGGLAFWGATAFPRAVAGPGWTLAAAVIWVAYGLLLVGFVIRMQRYGRRPALLVLLALAWGGFASLGIAGHANTAVQHVMANLGADQSAWIWTAGPAIEETVKALGIMLLILLPVLVRVRSLDGLFLGAVLGASFQVVENFSYTLAALETHADDPASAFATIVLLRGGFGIFSHVVFSALIGAAIGWVVAGGRAGRARRVILAIGAGLGALVLHAVGNWTATEGMIGPHLVVSLIGLAVLIVVLRSTRRTEAARLADWGLTAGVGVLDPHSLEALQTEPRGRADRRRRRAALRATAEAETAYLAAR